MEAELEETHREFVASQCELMSVETEDNLKETVIRAMKVSHFVRNQSNFEQTCRLFTLKISPRSGFVRECSEIGESDHYS